MIGWDTERPPRVVAFGGGHGLFASLKALCLLGIDPTAVVTVAALSTARTRFAISPYRAPSSPVRKDSCTQCDVAHALPPVGASLERGANDVEACGG